VWLRLDLATAAQYSVPDNHRDNALDTVDCRFAACGIFEHFAYTWLRVFPAPEHYPRVPQLVQTLSALNNWVTAIRLVNG